MDSQELDPQSRLAAVRDAVDAASLRHAQRVADVVRRGAGTANTAAKAAVFGALMGARYVSGFARGLLRSPNA